MEFSLDLLGGKGNIGKFRYVPLIGLDILTGILTKATKRSVSEFAAEYLFSPLKIDTPPNIFFYSKEEHCRGNPTDPCTIRYIFNLARIRHRS